MGLQAPGAGDRYLLERLYVYSTSNEPERAKNGPRAYLHALYALYELMRPPMYGVRAGSCNVATGGACTSSRCCQSPDFTCYSKNANFARCVTKCPDPAGQDPAEWSCELHDKYHKRLPPPPPNPSPPPPHPRPPCTVSPAPAAPFCSGNRRECVSSRCCLAANSVCYEKGPHHAECLPEGTCRERWPMEATCAVLAEVCVVPYD